MKEIVDFLAKLLVRVFDNNLGNERTDLIRDDSESLDAHYFITFKTIFDLVEISIPLSKISLQRVIFGLQIPQLTL